MASDAAQETFVAAFANSSAGDVSGNVELGRPPDGIHDRAQMEKHGRQQFDHAKALFDSADAEVLAGRVHFDFWKLSVHADGERRGLRRIQGKHRKGLDEAHLYVPSDRCSSSAFAVGILRDIEKKRTH